MSGSFFISNIYSIVPSHIEYFYLNFSIFKDLNFPKYAQKLMVGNRSLVSPIHNRSIQRVSQKYSEIKIN